MANWCDYGGESSVGHPQYRAWILRRLALLIFSAAVCVITLLSVAVLCSVQSVWGSRPSSQDRKNPGRSDQQLLIRIVIGASGSAVTVIISSREARRAVNRLAVGPGPAARPSGYCNEINHLSAGPRRRKGSLCRAYSHSAGRGHFAYLVIARPRRAERDASASWDKRSDNLAAIRSRDAT